MPFSGGTYSAPSLPGSWNPAIEGQNATATDWNTLLTDLSTALSTTITRNGQSTITADLPMNSHKLTGMAVGTASTDSATLGQVQGGGATYAASSGADTITATLAPAVTAYAVGQQFTFKKDTNANTGAVTLNLNGVGAGSVTWPNGTALVAGDLPANCMFTVATQATTPVFHLLSVSVPPLYKTGGSMSGAINQALGANIASASTTDIGAATGNTVHVTGTTTITSFGTVQAGTTRTVVFDGSLLLTYNATSLILPGAANITTAAGDTAVFVSEGSGNWRCVQYQRTQYSPSGGQIATLLTASCTTGTTAIPLDNSLPQNTEGDQYLSLSITPKSATSTLIIDICINVSSSALDNPVVALFQDSTANAIGAWVAQVSDAGACDVVRAQRTLTSGTTSSTTFKVRVGTTSGSTITVNGISGSALFGGVFWSSIVIREVL